MGDEEEQKQREQSVLRIAGVTGLDCVFMGGGCSDHGARGLMRVSAKNEFGEVTKAFGLNVWTLVKKVNGIKYNLSVIKTGMLAVILADLIPYALLKLSLL